MPSTDQILANLTLLADRFFLIAVLWHVVIALAVVGVAAGWRPPRRLAGVLLALPAFSVSVLAVTTRNWFNGLAFLLVAVLLVSHGLRLRHGPVTRGPPWAVAVGAATIGYGWVYPHFLPGAPAWAYLFGAPTGLVPCPTLGVILGFGLLAGGLGSRAWALSSGIAGLFYGLFGALRLGVWLDLGLVVASLAMLGCAFGFRGVSVVRGHRRASTPAR